MLTHKDHVEHHKALFKERYGQEIYNHLRIDYLSPAEAENAMWTYEHSFVKHEELPKVSEEMLNKMFLDAETDGLFGQPISIGVISVNADGTQDKFYSWIENYKSETEWVQENVVPHLRVEGFESSKDLDELLQKFVKFYNEHKYCTTVWHMGHIVEAYLFRLCVQKGLLGIFDTPYTPIEMSTMLVDRGFQPDSVDAIVKKFGLTVGEGNTNLQTHNALYDTYVEQSVFNFLMSYKR